MKRHWHEGNQYRCMRLTVAFACAHLSKRTAGPKINVTKMSRQVAIYIYIWGHVFRHSGERDSFVLVSLFI